MAMIRVLVMAESASLAHVGRAIAFALELPHNQFKCSYASGNSYRPFFAGLEAEFFPITSIDPERFNAALARGQPIYDEATVGLQVMEDLEILERARPDVVVGDFRLSLAISARISGIPYVNVCNAHWSPWRDGAQYPVPSLPITRRLTRMLGIRLTRRVFNFGLPRALAVHARGFNAVRRAYKLGDVPDIRWIYADGDIVAYADMPSVAPVSGQPKTHAYVGPLSWSPEVPLPEWWQDVPRDKPVAYVTMGSTGNPALLPVVARELSARGFASVIATAGRAGPITGVQDCFTATYLPGARACRSAKLVVCNGGSATVYQAMTQGRPVLGLPVNLDQALTMDGVARVGAGLAIAPTLQCAKTIAKGMDNVLACLESMTARCKDLATAGASEQRVVQPEVCVITALERRFPRATHRPASDRIRPDPGVEFRSEP